MRSTPRAQGSWRPLLGTVVLAMAATVVAAGSCPLDVRNGAMSTSDYKSCESSSMFSLDPRRRPIPDTNSFCRDCFPVFLYLRQRDALGCFDSSNADSLNLEDANKAVECFGDRAKPPTPAPTPSPTPRPTTTAPGPGPDPGPTPGPNPTPTISPMPTTKTPSDDSKSPSTSPKTRTPSTGSGSSTSSDPSGHSSNGGSKGGSNSSPRSTKTVVPGADPTTESSAGRDPRSPSGISTGSTVSAGSGTGGLPNAASVWKDPKTTNAPKAGGSNEKSSGSGMGAGAWAGIVGGVVSIIVLIVVLVYGGILRRRGQHQGPAGLPTDGQHPNSPTAANFLTISVSKNATGSTTVGSVASNGAHFWDDETINAVRIPYEKLTIDRLISRGGYGEVYKGTYRGRTVAIKSLLPERRTDMRQIQNFLAEVKLMAVMEHERIVRFIGVAWDSLSELCVVSEYVPRGDLRSLLLAFESDPGRAKGLGDVTKVKIALHVAHALAYMHSLQPMVLHRDLKSRNVLLDDELNAKITDFGVSRERADQTMTAGVGSSLWMAPEVMLGSRYDEKADIFSFGVLLSELDLHVLPYAHATETGTGRRLPDTVIVQLVSLGRLTVDFTPINTTSSPSPHLTNGTAQNELSPVVMDRMVQAMMVELGRACVNVDPQARPTTSEVLYKIHTCYRRLVDMR